MATTDLFVEVFPVDHTKIPALTAYQLQANTDVKDIGARLAARFSKAFPGQWWWSGTHLLTDMPALPVQMDITLNVLREQNVAGLAQLEGIAEDAAWHLDAYTAARWCIAMQVREYDGELREALGKLGLRLRNAYILREHVLAPWSVADYPSMSVSVRSHLLHDRNLQAVLESTDPGEMIGVHVKERLSQGEHGVVSEICGTLADLRTELIAEHEGDERWQKYLAQAPDNEFIVAVALASAQRRYPASLLRVLIRTSHADDWSRFDVDPEQALKALKTPPDTQAMLVRTISDILKTKGVIDNAFNSRKLADHFGLMDFMPSLEFANKRVHPYRPATLANDFVQNGLHTRHQRFDNKPINIAFINTLDDIATDFMEALSRQIERDFDIRINLVKERNVRVVNEKNIASAVRAVQKEDPNIVLAFFPDAVGATLDDYLKSQMIAKGIASHILHEGTIHNPNAMALVILSILAKTGNTPFALAEPLEYADLVIGLDLVREPLTRGDRVVAMTRHYRSDGVFERYLLDQAELDTDEPLPFVVLQKLFPEALCEGEEMIVHHRGVLPEDVLDKLLRWARVLNGVIHPVEIISDDVPQIYALGDGITQAPWGSLFRLNAHEAFAISSTATQDGTPVQPLHVRVPAGSLPVEQAVYSILASTLLYRSTAREAHVPVTVQRTQDIAQWFRRGMLPDATEGDVPFWL